jgi:chemotaxis protein methyltransferase CheR
MNSAMGETPVAGLGETREFTLKPRDFATIAGIMYEEAGIRLPESKANLVYSRLAKRVRELGLASFEDYCALISDRHETEERAAMIAALTTNVTQFFREMHHFEHLKTAIIPAMQEAVKQGRRVRIWSAACSSGQEPYSIALTLLSAWPDAASRDVKILATDIDHNMLAKGEAGIYADSVLKPVPAAMRQRWFDKHESGAREPTWRANAGLREMVAFRKLNLIGTWPMRGPFHAIFCRNVVIYFDVETQVKLWSRLVPLLAPDGALYIGHSERVAGPAEALLTGDGTTTYRPAGRPGAGQNGFGQQARKH